MAMSSTTSWFELPFDIKSNILARIGVVDLLENAQKVCIDWYKTCKNPVIWRVINMNETLGHILCHKLREMCKNAIDRSQGQLVDITIFYFGDDELLMYVANRSSQLKCLKISWRHGDLRLTEALKKFPLLEELSLYSTFIPKETIEIACHYCPMLKKLGFNKKSDIIVYANTRIYDEIAISISENLHELKHLELIRNEISNFGLRVILDGCCHLESLDLRGCKNLDLKGDLRKRCLEQIKYVKMPNDSLDGPKYGVSTWVSLDVDDGDNNNLTNDVDGDDDFDDDDDDYAGDNFTDDEDDFSDN